MVFYGESLGENGFPREMGETDDGMHYYDFIFGVDKWGTPRSHHTIKRSEERRVGKECGFSSVYLLTRGTFVFSKNVQQSLAFILRSPTKD